MYEHIYRYGTAGRRRVVNVSLVEWDSAAHRWFLHLLRWTNGRTSLETWTCSVQGFFASVLR